VTCIARAWNGTSTTSSSATRSDTTSSTRGGAEDRLGYRTENEETNYQNTEVLVHRVRLNFNFFNREITQLHQTRVLEST
jgi:hypothetical protein